MLRTEFNGINDTHKSPKTNSKDHRQEERTNKIDGRMAIRSGDKNQSKPSLEEVPSKSF